MTLQQEREPLELQEFDTKVGPSRGPGPASLDEIIKRGSLRVGCARNLYPWAYRNSRGKIVGFDVQMAAELAADMDLDLEIVISDHKAWQNDLNLGTVDIIMSGLMVTPSRAMVVDFTSPYLSITWAFVVPDYLVHEYNSSEMLHRKRGQKIACMDDPYLIQKAQRMAPNATIIPVHWPKYPTAFFTEPHPEVDALFIGAESGSAWCLLYPHFGVAVPRPDAESGPMAYPVARGNQEWLDFLNVWIELKKQDKTVQTLFDYWIRGQGAEVEKPRWSVWGNLLDPGRRAEKE